MYNETDFSEYIPNDSSLKWYQLEPNDAKELVIKLVLFVYGGCNLNCVKACS